MQSTANPKALFLLFNSLSRSSFQHLKLIDNQLKLINIKLAEAKDSNLYNLGVFGDFIAKRDKDRISVLCFKVKIKLLIAFAYA